MSEATRAASAPGARRAAGLGLRIALVVVLLWLAGWPLLITLLEAVGAPAAPTLEHVRGFAARPDEWMAVWRSFWTSAASVALSALVGVPLAVVFARWDFPGRRLLGALVALPVALPPLVGVIAFLFLYGESGFVARFVGWALHLDAAPWRLQGAGAILLVHAYSMYVYFYLFVRAALVRIDPALEEAAAALGASRWRTWTRVLLPQLAPALAGASLLTFMTSLGSFSAPYIFGGDFRVMTTQIVASKLNGDLELARVEALALAVVALAALAFLRFIERGAASRIGGGHGLAPRRPRRPGRRAQFAATALGWTAAVVLLLPHGTLVLLSLVPPATWTTEALPPILGLGNYAALVDAERLRPILNSLWMAAVATVAALALGGLAAWQERRGGRLGTALEVLVGLPWAIPATVFAVALATAMAVDAPLMGRFVLVGTPWILVLAYIARSLPLTGRATLAGLRRLDPALEEAAASLGAGPARIVRRVVLPILAPALGAGAGLAFVTAVGDFVTSIVLYTYDSRPISVEIYGNLRIQELGIAAAYGVLLVTLSAAGFLAWNRGDDAPV